MFICVGPYYWGKGDTKEIAMKNCAKVGGIGMRELKKHYLLYSGPSDTTVNEIDGSVWSTGEVTLVEKKGQ